MIAQIVFIVCDRLFASCFTGFSIRGCNSGSNRKIMTTSKGLLYVSGYARAIGQASIRTIALLFSALLGLVAQPSMAQVYDPYTGPDLAAPSIRLMAEPFAAAAVQGPVSVSIRSLNAQTFPFVFLDVDATDDTGTCPLFSAGNFQVLEDGVPQTDYFTVTPPNENQGVRLVDVVFIMDNSGSMSDNQLAVRNNVYGFVDKLAKAGINFALASRAMAKVRTRAPPSSRITAT